MDTNYMSELVLSVLIFAPGVVLLSICAFVGGLVLLEKAGVLGAAQEQEQTAEVHAAASPNPPAGQVIAGLEQAIAQEAEVEQDGTNGR